MNRTRKLLTAFLPPVVAGVAVGVSGASDSKHSTDNAPSRELSVLEVREKTADETVISSLGVQETGQKKVDYEAVEKVLDEIEAALPKQPVERSNWKTKVDLATKLPNIKTEVIDAALDVLKQDHRIVAFKDDSGAMRYAQSYSPEAINDAWKEILKLLPQQPIERSKWLTMDDLTKKLPKLESELLDEALETLKEDRQITASKDDSGTWRYAQSYSAEAVRDASNEIMEVLAQQPAEQSKWMTKDDLAKKLSKLKSELVDDALDSLNEDGKLIVVKDNSGIFRYGKRPTRQG